MVDLSTVVEPVQTYRTVLNGLLILAIIISFVLFMLNFIYEMEDSNHKMEYAGKGKFRKVTILSFVVLVLSVLGTAYNTMSINKIEKSNTEIQTIALIENISYFLTENEEKIANGEMSSPEIKAHFSVNGPYYTMFIGVDVDLIEHTIKKHVYNNYDKENPLYKEVIMERKRVLD